MHGTYFWKSSEERIKKALNELLTLLSRSVQLEKVWLLSADNELKWSAMILQWNLDITNLY